MKRINLALGAAALLIVAFVAGAATAAPGDLTRSNNSGGNATQIPAIPGTLCWRLSNQTFRPEGTPFSACSTTTTTPPPTTTGAPSTTTLAPTTTSTTTPATSTTTTSSTPPATTTTVPGGVQFVETFDGPTGLNRFNKGVWHRDPYLVYQSSWTADHANLGNGDCGTPDTTRVVHRNVTSESIYECESVIGSVGAAHFMTSMGDTSGYSIVWFSPNQVFGSVDSVAFNVNLTNLGDRKWWKVGVVSDARYNSTYNGSCCGPAPGFLASDVGSADLPTSLATSDLFMATWGGGDSGGCAVGFTGPCGGLKIGNTRTNVFVNPAPNDKMTRYPVSLVDNHNGTVTFVVAGVSQTRSGAFPACPCRVVFADHNYTPLKDGAIQGTSWHWDDVIVR